MNPLLRILAAGGLLAATHAFATEAFEGKVTLAITSDKGRTQAIDWSMKAQKQRLDITTEKHQMSMIMDLEKMEMLMLMPGQGTYMVMPIKKPVEQALAKPGESTADIERTGKTETILGYKCDQILMKDKGTVTEMWVAPDLGTFMGLGGGGGGGGGMGGRFGGGRRGGGGAAGEKWEEALKGKGGFPLRVVAHDAKGNETYRMEATKIEPGPLPDSLFVPPEGSKQFSMPNLGDMFKRGCGSWQGGESLHRRCPARNGVRAPPSRQKAGREARPSFLSGLDQAHPPSPGGLQLPIFRSSAAVQGAVRPASSARIRATVSGLISGALLPHSDRT